MVTLFRSRRDRLVETRLGNRIARASRDYMRTDPFYVPHPRIEAFSRMEVA